MVKIKIIGVLFQLETWFSELAPLRQDVRPAVRHVQNRGRIRRRSTALPALAAAALAAAAAALAAAPSRCGKAVQVEHIRLTLG